MTNRPEPPPYPEPGQGRLAGKVAIVTGAGNVGDGVGNGRAASILFAREGARVLLVDVDQDAVQGTADIIAREGGETDILIADVSAEEDCQAIVRRAVDRWGKLDVLHNNVGIAINGTILDQSIEEWEHVQRVNVSSMVMMGRAAVPVMRESGGGSIINVSSIAAFRPRGITAYSVSKGAVVALTHAMARDHGPDGIRVNCVMPGPIYSPRMTGRGVDEERRERRRRASALQREGTGWDVGYAALYLASDEARYVSGVVLPVDGGVLVMSPER